MRFRPLPREARSIARRMRGLGAAAADMPAHLREDLSASRVRILLQQIGRAHDLTGLAIAALRRPLGQPSLLQGCEESGESPLDRRCHFLAGNIRRTCVWHENARLPSTCNTQAPQRPTPQPNLVPVSLSSSRITQSSGVTAGASTLTAEPFTVNWKGSSSYPPSLPSDPLLLTGSLSEQMTNGNDTCPLGSLRDRIFGASTSNGAHGRDSPDGSRSEWRV